MGDYVQVVPGMPPWQPSHDSELEAEYAYYDFPTVGIVSQHGAHYLFRCVVGAEDDASFWVYTLIQEAERKLIESATSATEFDHAVTSLQLGHPATVAVMVEGVGIAAYTFINWLDGPKQLEQAVEDLVGQLQNFATHARDTATMI